MPSSLYSFAIQRPTAFKRNTNTRRSAVSTKRAFKKFNKQAQHNDSSDDESDIEYEIQVFEIPVRGRSQSHQSKRFIQETLQFQVSVLPASLSVITMTARMNSLNLVLLNTLKVTMTVNLIRMFRLTMLLIPILIPRWMMRRLSLTPILTLKLIWRGNLCDGSDDEVDANDVSLEGDWSGDESDSDSEVDSDLEYDVSDEEGGPEYLEIVHDGHDSDSDSDSESDEEGAFMYYAYNNPTIN
ncbi:hypothetical protein BCR33DRAFT_717109 [Rhizoclosmatium globosum]|uniref:Uncharacterized protein n=1 Tax=Rhizoclosmatium globosum TaxID=329046 RepID=A0A1Y2CAM9_9FUNG|nr:hypothetical protein BCR33DRAFT_717109 [Rhizoclosmatium globosum]|eukprot:ORY43986.1 hypothetical protein BCR33DRAFT_717109 [Rhizoclosmatium globosum]